MKKKAPVSKFITMGNSDCEFFNKKAFDRGEETRIEFSCVAAQNQSHSQIPAQNHPPPEQEDPNCLTILDSDEEEALAQSENKYLQSFHRQTQRYERHRPPSIPQDDICDPRSLIIEH